MFPNHFLQLFPAFPRTDRVFVAMSFDERFRSRWTDVIAPAVESVELDGRRLEPHRVDARSVSDSILTEILDSIGSARLVLADISTSGYLEGVAVRNANVMYELGVAHASRLPEEVILLRSDSDPLSFDIAPVRVNSYDPDTEPLGARAVVRGLIAGALKEAQAQKLLAVRKGALTLDAVAFGVLGAAATSDGLQPPQLLTARQILGNVHRHGAIQRLIELGAIETIYPRIQLADLQGSPDAPLDIRYRATPFGLAIMEHIAHTVAGSPSVREAAAML